VSTLICEHTDRGVNPDPAAKCAHREQRQGQVRYREVSPGISPTCVRAMVMLAPRSVATIANPARTTLGYAPEATIATIRLAARVTVVASHAHGSLGADIEKNMVPMSRRRRSRSGRGYSTARAYQIAWTVSVGVVCSTHRANLFLHWSVHENLPSPTIVGGFQGPMIGARWFHALIMTHRQASSQELVTLQPWR